MTSEDESTMSTVLPVDNPSDARKQPWLLHMLQVNTLNFCSFAHCAVLPSQDQRDEILIAVPNTLTSEKVELTYLSRSVTF